VIVVVGSRHDPVARGLVEALPSALLCGADDLTRSGWVWPLGSPEDACWVVEGRVVPDREVTGVWVRRNYVYPEELVGTHPDDREYLAAEATAFLVFVLSRTGARVVNPVGDGALGDDIVRPERWMPVAAAAGVPVRPLRMRAGDGLTPPPRTTRATVAGGEVFGDATPARRRAAQAMAAALGLPYVVFVFDGQRRLVTLSTLMAPGDDEIAALAGFLGGRG
jgi:hypothetical protein